MQYMLLIYEDPTFHASEEEMGAIMGEYMAFTREIVASGEFVGGDPLQPVTTATTVRIRNGVKAITDGPFAETTEVLGGYYLVDVADLDRALELAARIPASRSGSIEVRAIMELPSMA